VSESLKQVSAALVKAQRGFAPALKTSTNPHFKSRYADLAVCVEAVVDALNEAGIMLMQRQHHFEGGVAVETIFVHESGEQLSAGILSVPASKKDAQGYGSALTYARRYSLMAACGIAPEDDDGNAAAKVKRPQEKPVQAEEMQSDSLDEDSERAAELRELALYLIDCHAQGKEMDAVRAFYAAETWSADNPTATEEQMYVWRLLKTESKLRSMLKANNPRLKTE
jgi:hypothetical protein